MYDKGIEFEWDPDKSAQNLVKHGISFMEAQALWEDEFVVELPARDEDEDRFLVIGRIGDLYWTAIITYREARVRIISVRRTRSLEVSIYE